MNNIQSIKGKTIIVDRTKWLRSVNMEKEGYSYLLRQSDGKMCCIGAAALQCGYTKDDIEDMATPISIGWNELSVNIIDKMMMVNDDVKTTDVEKEKELKILAEQFGFKFEFIN